MKGATTIRREQQGQIEKTERKDGEKRGGVCDGGDGSYCRTGAARRGGIKGGKKSKSVAADVQFQLKGKFRVIIKISITEIWELSEKGETGEEARRFPSLLLVLPRNKVV